MKEKKKFRLNLDFSEEVRDRLDRLKELTDSGSNVEVIRRSLALLELVLDYDSSIHVKDNDGNMKEIRVI